MGDNAIVDDGRTLTEQLGWPTRSAVALKVLRLSPAAKMPTRGTADSAGWDIYAPIRVVLKANEPVVIGCGFAMALPRGFEAQIRPRSSFSKQGIHCAFGTIDADYRGEVGVTIVKCKRADSYVPGNQGYVPDEYVIEAGDRIAQMLIAPVPTVFMVEVDTLAALGETVRGDGGWGSTGK